MKKKVAILNFAGCDNYGANLTAYALLQQCRRFGWEPRLVDRRYAYDFQPRGYIFTEFSRRYFKWTSPCYGPECAKRLNGDYDAFIVGSDQVWAYRPDWIRSLTVQHCTLYDLSFVAPGKGRIAMAASFGGGDFSEAPDAYCEARARALRLFNGISVREKSGVDICRRRFGVEARHVLDPVFFLNADEWRRLVARDHSRLPGRYAATCLLEDAFRPVLKRILVCCGGEGAPMPAVNTMRGSIEAWVRTIADSEFVITDSFHVTCFAIIFRKPFIYLNPADRGVERVPSMLEDFHLEFPCFSQKEACAASDAVLARAVDKARSSSYGDAFEKALSQRIQATRGFLEDSLSAEPAKDAPPIVVDPERARKECKGWNFFRFALLKRFVLRTALYGWWQKWRESKGA